jgi:hypothetical protein
MDKIDSAKQLFWEYSCNHFFLYHDDKMDEYIKLGGKDPQKEKEWRKEYIEYWMDKVETDELKAFNKLSYADATEILKQLTKKRHFKDDYIKFWYAFTLINLANIKDSNKRDKINAIKKAKTILNELINKDISLSSQSEKSITKEMMESLKANTKKEYIITYSKKLINKWLTMQFKLTAFYAFGFLEILK